MKGSNFSNAESAWIASLRQIIEDGKKVETRGLYTYEISPFYITVTNPQKRLFLNPVRKINLAFAISEFLWIFNGHDRVDRISWCNTSIKKYSDDGVTFHGAYGKRLRKHRDQFSLLLSKFKKDIGTRQAVMTIFDPDLDFSPSKDIPCTINLHLMARENVLNCIAYMRSNDLYRGAPYDIFNFTMLQEIFSQILNLGVGEYQHIVGSMHLYENDLFSVKRVLAGCHQNNENIPYDDTFILPKSDNTMNDVLSVDEIVDCIISNKYTYGNKVNDLITKLDKSTELTHKLSSVLVFYYLLYSRDVPLLKKLLATLLERKSSNFAYLNEVFHRRFIYEQ